jgi:hypothetical protein
VGALKAFLRLAQIGKSLGHPDRPLSLGAFGEDVGHFPFEVQPVVEHQVGLLNPRQVIGPRNEEVRIDPGAHEAIHLHPLAPDRLRGVRDHARGRQHADRDAIGEVVARQFAARLLATAAADSRNSD